MSYSKKMLSILIATLLTVSIGITVPVKADVDVSVSTVGDVNLTVEIVDGSLTIIYNGVNILAELNSLQNSVQGLSTYMSYLATKTEMSGLNQTVNRLVGELDEVLEDLYGNTVFLAYVIGLNSNSTVGANLLSGDYTIAGYFESMITALDNVSSDVITIDKALSETNVELLAFGNYTEGKFNSTYLEIENLADYTNNQLNNIYFELNEQNEKLKESMVKDVLTLDTMIQAETNRQTIAEENFKALEKRLEDYILKETTEDADTRKLFSVFLVAVAGSVITVGLVYTGKKKNNNSTVAAQKH